MRSRALLPRRITALRHTREAKVVVLQRGRERMSDKDVVDALLIKVNADLKNPNVHRIENAVLKEGPQAWKVASLLYLGPPGTAEVKQTTLQCRTYPRKKIPEAGYDFLAPTFKWSCDDGEIDRLKHFLNAQLGEPGTYEVVPTESATGALLQALVEGNVDSAAVIEVVRGLAGNAAIVEALSGTPVASLLAAAVELYRHREVHEELRRLIGDEATTEPNLQDILEREWWLFGGRYVRRLDRRQFTAFDQVDFVLERTDGAAHIIEIKKANVPASVVHYRRHLSVGKEVNLAVNQAMNYVRQFDRFEATLREDFGIDCRRVHATVVIGHPDHNGVDDVSAEQFHQTYRSYNSHLARVEVISYAELLATAENDIASLVQRVERGGEDPAPPDDPPPPDEPPPDDDEWRYARPVAPGDDVPF